MSFGRKGLSPGQTAPAGVRPATRIDHADIAVAARREVARPAAPEAVAAPETDHDPLASLRNGARPATRREEPVGQEWSPLSEAERQRARAAGIGAVRPHQDKRFIFGEPHKRSLALAYVFWFIAGQGSLHRFYCGQTQSAIMQIGLLVGSVLIGLIFMPMAVAGLFAWFFWIIADLFLIPGMMRRFKAEYAPYNAGIFA
jgi:TM2 domain-containing membrane protein YozV